MPNYLSIACVLPCYLLLLEAGSSDWHKSLSQPSHYNTALLLYSPPTIQPSPSLHSLLPTPSLLTPHSSLLSPHSSLLTPHSSLLKQLTSRQSSVSNFSNSLTQSCTCLRHSIKPYCSGCWTKFYNVHFTMLGCGIGHHN